VGVGAVGLVIPLSSVFAGLSVIVDRHTGAHRELLAAPIPRAFMVLGNLIVALGLAALQALVVVGLSALRGGVFHITAAGVAWFLGASLLFTVFMYGLAETVSEPGEQGGGLRRGHAGAGDPAVLLRRRAVPDRRDARGAHGHRQGHAADARAGAPAIWVHRPIRQGPARHLGHAQRDYRGVAELGGSGGVRGCASGDRDPGIRALGCEVDGRARGGARVRQDAGALGRRCRAPVAVRPPVVNAGRAAVRAAPDEMSEMDDKEPRTTDVGGLLHP